MFGDFDDAVPASQQDGAEEEDEDEGEGAGYGDLFGGFDGGEESQPKTKSSEKEMLHTRRDSSVLFSLDDLVQKEPESTEPQLTEDSGLIDIRQVALEQQSDDLFAGMDGEAGTPAPSVVPQAALSMPLLRKKKQWPVALAASIGGLLVLVAAAYGAMTIYGGPGEEIILQSMASASERAYADRKTQLAKLSAEQQGFVDAAKARAETKLAELRADSVGKASDMEKATVAALAELRTLNQQRIGELEHKLAEARKIAEESKKKRVLLAAAEKAKLADAAVTGDGGPSTGDKGAVDGAAKDKKSPVKERELTDKERKERAKKRAERKKKRAEEKAKKKDLAKLALKKEDKKKDDKVVEKKEEKKDDKKDPHALLMALDKKKAGGDGDDAGAKKPSKKTLTTTDIMRVVNKAKPKMRNCFKKYGAGLESATIRTKLKISGSGAVTNVGISSMEFAGTALGNCVKKIQKKMKFPAFAKPSLTKSISVRLP